MFLKLFMFLKFVYLFWMFIYEYVKFNTKNLFCRKLIGKKSYDRLEFIKCITNHLERNNIVYVKVFQSLCLEQEILSNQEKDYLITYTDNVPYNNNEIDFTILDKLNDEFGIHIEKRTPINSGIVGVVFKGTNRENKKIVVKMLKQGIIEKYKHAYMELELLTKFLKWVPYLNNINYSKMISDSKESILSQTDFKKECSNIEIFKNKHKNNKDFVIPSVYSDITEKYNNIIVMTDITGLRYHDIKNYDESIKYEFANLLIKFGLLSILFYSSINGDLHLGNLFFYIDNNEDASGNILLEYKLGIIDYGLCYYPSLENQNVYYTFFNDILTNNNFSKIVYVITGLIENKEDFNKFNSNKKNIFIEDVIDCIKKYCYENFDINFFFNLSKIFKTYDLLFTKEFNNICMSMQIVNSLALSLYHDPSIIINNAMKKFEQMNKLIELD